MEQTPAQAAKPERAALGGFVSVAIQLGLLVLIARLFHLENPLFYEKLMPIALAGFLVQYFLPRRYRLPFFIAVSLAGIHAGLGLANTLWLVGIGLLLIGACHLPLAFAVRVGLVAAIGAALALLRSGRLQASWADSVVPILASMFMFRIIVYLYDLKHQKDKPSASHALAYFFLLPNIVFPLFPIVDYTTFRRSHEQRDRRQIHQKGIHWMMWGIVELILYRYVNHYWLIPREDVTGLSTLAQHAASNYLLILRVLGQFNLAIGMLHLFGFDLPPVTDKFFLAPGFTDFWRRANIYWKDFMQKVFFYPLYFKLRMLTPIPRLVVSMVIVFVVTWFLHAYQWFWVRGTLLLSDTDMLFWTFFGVLVIGNAVWETKRGRQAKAAAPTGSLRDLASRAARALLMFALIAVMWSLWTSASISEWTDLWFHTEISAPEVARFVPVILLAFLGMLAATFLLEGREQLVAGSGKQMQPGLTFLHPAAVTAVSMVLLVLLGSPGTPSQLNRKAAAMVTNLQGAKLSARETELLTRGYYEDLNAANQFNNALQNTELYELYAKRGEAWPAFRDTVAGRATNTFLRDDVAPSVSFDFHGAPMSINRWGMRDKDYEQRKPAGVYRIALLGASGPFGSGVADNETFEAVLEERLNSAPAAGSQLRYEVLNFSVPGYAPPQQLMLLETKVLSFEPDAVFLIGTTRDDTSSARHLAVAVGMGVQIPYDFLRSYVEKTHIQRRTRFEESFRRLKRYREDMIKEIYPRFAARCRSQGALPVFVYTPIIQEAAGEEPEDSVDRFVRLAKASGFAVVDVSNAWQGEDASRLRVREWDWHPNARAHKLLGDRLYEVLKENDQGLGLKLVAAAK